MTRRDTDVAVLAVPLTVLDRALCDRVKDATGLTRDTDLGRAALYRFAVHVLGKRQVNTDRFALRGMTRRVAGRSSHFPAQRRRRAFAKARQEPP